MAGVALAASGDGVEEHSGGAGDAHRRVVVDAEADSRVIRAGGDAAVGGGVVGVGEEGDDQVGVEESVESAINGQGVVSESGHLEEDLNGGGGSGEGDSDGVGDGERAWSSCDIHNLVQDDIAFNFEGILDLIFSSSSSGKLVKSSTQYHIDDEVDLIGGSNSDLLEDEDVAEGHHCAQRGGCQWLIGPGHVIVEVQV